MEEQLLKTIEDIQEAIVEKGGKFLKQQEIKDMKFEDLLKLITPNGIGFKVEY